MEAKTITYREMAAALAALTDEQLHQDARAWGERIGPIRGLVVLSEPYTHLSGEGIEPVSTYAHDSDAHREALKQIAWPAGTVFVDVDEAVLSAAALLAPTEQRAAERERARCVAIVTEAAEAAERRALALDDDIEKMRDIDEIEAAEAEAHLLGQIVVLLQGGP